MGRYNGVVYTRVIRVIRVTEGFSQLLCAQCHNCLVLALHVYPQLRLSSIGLVANGAPVPLLLPLKSSTIRGADQGLLQVRNRGLSAPPGVGRPGVSSGGLRSLAQRR